MASFAIQHLSYRYPNSPFSLSIDFEVKAPIKLAILGPNGSGKSTLLRLLGGHLKADSGRILWGDRDICGMSPQKRPVATVFQDCALFPQLNVRENIEFAIRYKSRKSKADVSLLSRQWLNRLDLDDICERMPSELSIGYQQRVAIARALAVQPEFLLLDEPSAALDVRQQQELVILLNRVIEHTWAGGIVLVTHDLDLAFSTADTVAVLNQGRLESIDDASKLQSHPSSLWLARYLNYHNVLSGTITPDGVFNFETYRIPTTVLDRRGEVTVLLDSTAILAGRYKVSAASLEAVVVARVYRGTFCEVLTDVGSHRVRCTFSDPNALPRVGERIFLVFDLDRGVIFP